jgi:MFS family permease
VAGQIATPLAGDLSAEADRGRVVGTVIFGMLTGILVSRTLSGLIANATGWRVIYVVAAAIGTPTACEPSDDSADRGEQGLGS